MTGWPKGVGEPALVPQDSGRAAWGRHALLVAGSRERERSAQWEGSGRQHGV